MQHRLAHLIKHRSIELDLPALDLELDFLSKGARRVTYNARKSLEDLPDGNHPARHDLVLEVCKDLRRAQRRLEQRMVAELLGDLRDAIARNHQLAHDGHQSVEALGIDADVARGFLRRSGR